LVNVPVAVGVTTMVTVTLALLASVPNTQVTVIPPASRGCLVLGKISVTPAGNVS